MRALALAVALVTALWTAPALAGGGGPEAARPWIGIGIDAAPNGVLVKEVMERTPAARAGLRKADVVISIDGQAVQKPAELIAVVQGKGVGAKVALRVLRDGKEQTITLSLEARPDELKLLRDRLLDKPAPAFALGERVGPHAAGTAELKGQVVLVEFWATWCGACRSSMPRLSSWHEKYAAKGLRIVAVSHDDNKAKLTTWAKEQKLGFTFAYDADGKVSEQYNVQAIPTMVLIDRAGVVRFVDVGAGQKLDGVEQALQKLLEEPGAASQQGGSEPSPPPRQAKPAGAPPAAPAK